MPNPENLKSWKPGQSGNKKGKPKGALSAKTVINKWLSVEENIKNPITGKVERMNQYDAIVLAQLAKARSKDTPAFNALLDRIEGKAPQHIDLTTPEPIQLIFNPAPNCDPLPNDNSSD